MRAFRILDARNVQLFALSMATGERPCDGSERKMQGKFIRNDDIGIKKPASGGGKLASGKVIGLLVLIDRTRLVQVRRFVNGAHQAI